MPSKRGHTSKKKTFVACAKKCDVFSCSLFGYRFCYLPHWKQPKALFSWKTEKWPLELFYVQKDGSWVCLFCPFSRNWTAIITREYMDDSSCLGVISRLFGFHFKTLGTFVFWLTGNWYVFVFCFLLFSFSLFWGVFSTPRSAPLPSLLDTTCDLVIKKYSLC